MKSRRDILDIADIEYSEKVRSYSFDAKNSRFSIVFEDIAPKELGGHIRYDTLFCGIELEPATRIREYGRLSKR